MTVSIVLTDYTYDISGLYRAMQSLVIEHIGLSKRIRPVKAIQVANVSTYDYIYVATESMVVRIKTSIHTALSVGGFQANTDVFTDATVDRWALNWDNVSGCDANDPLATCQEVNQILVETQMMPKVFKKQILKALLKTTI